MATFIFSTLGAKGHVHPAGGIARILRERGHTVALYTSSHYRYVAEKLDLIFLPPQKWLDFDFANFENYWPELGQFEGAGRSMQIYFKIFMATALDQANDLNTYYEQLKPDVMITDPFAFGTQILALKLKLPWAVTGVSIGSLALPILGQRGIPLANKPYLYLAQGVPSLDEDNSGKPSRIHYIGSSDWDEGESEAYSEFQFPDTSLPLVFASHGTMFARPHFFKKLIEASREQNWHTLIINSQKIDPAIFEPLPENVTTSNYIPYSQVWSKVSLAINHGSTGSILGALSHSIPLIVTPLEADHIANANQIARARAGLRLGVDSVTVEEIRAAIIEALNNPEYRQNAALIAAELKNMGGAERGADLLEELAVNKEPLETTSQVGSKK